MTLAVAGRALRGPACDEDEFSTRPIRGIADIGGDIALFEERGLDLIARAETQRRLRRQHLSIGEHECPPESHQR
jgi:hypothetical protein